MANWTLLTNHARVLLCIAHDPAVRLRDIAARLDMSARSAYGIVTDLAGAGSYAGTITRQAGSRVGRRPGSFVPAVWSSARWHSSFAPTAKDAARTSRRTPLMP